MALKGVVSDRVERDLIGQGVPPLNVTRGMALYARDKTINIMRRDKGGLDPEAAYQATLNGKPVHVFIQDCDVALDNYESHASELFCKPVVFHVPFYKQSDIESVVNKIRSKFKGSEVSKEREHGDFSKYEALFSRQM